MFLVSVSNSNGETAAIFSKLGNVNMDLDGVEGIESRALGGTDHVVIGDLTGTDLTSADLDLRGLSGGGDDAADTVTGDGIQGDDAFGPLGDADGVSVSGLHVAVNILFQEQTTTASYSTALAARIRLTPICWVLTPSS